MLAILGLFLFPYATYGRSFGGTGTLLLLTGQVLDVTGFAAPTLPPAGTALAFGWAALVGLLAIVALAFLRSRWLWLGGLVTLVLGLVSGIAFESALGAEVQRLLAGGTPLRRIGYASGGLNLGLFMVLLASLVTLLAGASASPAWYGRLNRLRALMVPFVAIALAVVVGAIVVLIIQPVPVEGATRLTPAIAWYGKIDVVWFVYSTLFAPLGNLSDFFQSLTLATPLIFTGLSVAFAFRAGLFNIGAPGQLAIGAVFAMIVGVYAPLPPVLLLPLTVIAAALGGALWGAIPGILKARFGSSEVINTIMLNYIASAVFIFLIGSNSFPLFGRTYGLPFKPPGANEATSQDLQEGARLPSLPDLLGFQSNQSGFVPLAPLLALLVLTALYVLLARHPRRTLIAIGASLLTLLLSWSWFGVRVQVTSGLAGSNLNAALFLALLAVVFFAVFMWRTSSGYALRAVGFAPKAAEYGGISVARNTVLAMTLAGAFAGLAATHYVMGGALDEYRLKQNLPYQNVGFDGITVALMGQSTPVGVAAAAVLFGTLDTGGLYVSQQLGKVNKDIVTVLKALIVLFIAAGGFLSKRITDPPPAVLQPNVGKVSGESREALGHKDRNDAGRTGEGPTATPASNPNNDGRDA
ncbi:ABC-type uncharacterized transport system, permease component [Deinococcus peraridilitoris DSM 19664]|uniref:ABC-type uncharacterized transport system, permease component n=1 Tax=Deinococcus peraridilitoris (strain DSM 19664 / LMG 22246 / CIP 109416 / KR-200) TaxID=937777 RepID=L0A615_DEIPD|nr:ABC-type uncharacterized transport system, permease component [Deinococcus peraridilitoris DSM 19664]